MSGLNSITCDKLSRLIGTPGSPAIFDVRTHEDFKAAPVLVPSSLRRAAADVAAWGQALRGRSVVVLCNRGLALGEGVAAWLRQLGCEADNLEGGFSAWKAAGLPVVPEAKIPPRGVQGQTLWVTRARPKVDRIACPWLIRRFIDPGATFLYVAAAQVESVAEEFQATPFDVENVFWSHRGELCTFDVMVEEFNLATKPLQMLAKIVRAADTARLDLAPQAAGLLAASLGLSRMYSDDLAQLEAGMGLYDAFYRWCRDAVEESHNWPSSKTKS